MSDRTKMPRSLRYVPDPIRKGRFQVVDESGQVWAESVRNAAAARVFAASPGLLLGYDWMLVEVLQYFHVRWDIGYGECDADEFVVDDGELEESYPGAPDYARQLKDLQERARAVRTSACESPIESYSEPQLDLF